MGESLDEKSDSSAGVNRSAASMQKLTPVCMISNLDGLGAGVLVAAEDGHGAGVLIAFAEGLGAGVLVTLADGLGMGVLRSMTSLPSAGAEL